MRGGRPQRSYVRVAWGTAPFFFSSVTWLGKAPSEPRGGTMRSERRRRLPPGRPLAQRERERAFLRAKVEYPFLYVKRRFGYDRVRYRGLAKNHNRLALLLSLTNLLIAEPQLV